MNRLKSILQILSIIWITTVLSACVDEGPGRYVSSDSEVLVNLEAAFSPFAEGDLTRASNVAPARGFNTISDMAVLVFDNERRLLPDYLKEVINPETIDVDRSDEDAAYDKSAESDTKRVADVPLLLPSGTYYIVAVANFGEYESDESGAISIKQDINGRYITSLAKIVQEINVRQNFTLDDLRSLKVGWDAEDYANNRAMLGFFSLSNSKPDAGSKFETVTLDRSGQKPRAWLRRCASKITVDFDGSCLRDNVSIFIKDVRIFDLAKECTLGFGNPTSDEENLTDFNNHPSSEADLIQRPSSEYNGHYIEFGEGDNPDSWLRISQNTPKIKDADANDKDLHTQDSECLYFYENMQGTRENYDRSPKPNLSEGGLAEGYNEKDGVPYGTYIEVSARHVVEEDGESHSKDIKYRFMIGKNATDNFDAERNHHYKLTLAFNGTSDEYHWHIDYTREEGFKVPNPWYVSYVYNHDAYLPFEFNLSDAWEVQDMVAEIVTNPWYPTSSGSSAEGLDADFTDPDFEITPTIPDGDDSYPYVANPENLNNCNGFLSLIAPSDETVLTDQRVGFDFTDNRYNDNSLLTNSEAYYNGRQAGTDSQGNTVTPVNLGERIVIKDANTYKYPEEIKREELSVKRENGVYNISIPLFTREKALIKQSGYSGSNPFVGYQRVAKVKLTAKVRKKDDHDVTKYFEAFVNVVQVRRVVNPVGVYRKSGNNEPFHVNLKYLTSERADGKFEPIISRGPWMAEVLGDGNFITLDGKQRVSGASRSEIDFAIRFNRMGGSGNKNAIVRIKYHNYTCTHLIFVRQGYDSQAICGGGPVYENPNAPATRWNTFNMVAGNVMADDPRDEGSMFKFGNSHNAISSINNIYKDADGNPIYYEQSKDGFEPQDKLIIIKADGDVNTENDQWSKIGMFNDGFTHWPELKIAKTATMRDFEQLYLTKYIEFGYGVLYADGATETQTSLEMVNGWYRDDPSPDKNKKGMRGVFAYYWNPSEPNNEYNAKNIFFPIGRSGYGHRKNSNEESKWNWSVERKGYNGKGILRYSAIRPLPAKDCAVPAFQKYAPLFEFLYRKMGAIYWARNKTAERAYYAWNGKPDEGHALGLDLNYFSFDVNSISDAGGVLDNGNDACFVRTVESSAGD